MNHLTRLLKTFDYHVVGSFMLSLAPSGKYAITGMLLFASFLWGSIDKVFGLDQAAFVSLLVIFITELISGIWAAMARGEKFQSVKLSRFSLKMACYLIIIGVSYCMSLSFQSHHENVAYWAFDWLHTVLVAHVCLENIVSVLENIASISGKPKDAIITKITDKFKTLI